MRLYYFTKQQYGLQAIRDRRLKIARVNELNDPFEFIGVRLFPAERRALMNWKNDMHLGYGLICMSETWQHPLQWAHYADGYKGLCLGIDVPESHAASVEYISERPKLDELVRSLSQLAGPEMHRLLHLKFDAWAYEHERRLFCRLEQRDPVTGLYFADFTDELQLAEVIVGPRSDVSHEQLSDVIRGRYERPIPTRKARAAFQTFEVVENRSRKIWPRDSGAT